MKVAFVLAEQMLAASMLLPNEMWRAAEHARIASRQEGTALDILTISVDVQPVTTHSGISLSPSHLPATSGMVDVVYVPALWRNPRPSQSSAIWRRNLPQPVC